MTKDKIIDLQNKEGHNPRLDRQIEEEQAAFAGEPYRIPEQESTQDLFNDFSQAADRYITNTRKNLDALQEANKMIANSFKL